MKINKYLPFAVLYFFLNSAGLPHGLTYTALLSPIFYVWLWMQHKRHILYPFFLIITPFALIHLVNGVELFYYVRSFVLYLSVYVFSYATYTFIQLYSRLAWIYRWLVLINLGLTLLAVAAYTTPYRDWFWMTHADLSANIHNFTRLTMFTYEPSVYSLLLVPVAFFYLLQFIEKPTLRTLSNFVILIGFPLLLSFSLGVWLGIGLSLIIFLLIHFSRIRIPRGFWRSTLLLLTGLLAVLIFLLLFYRANPLFLRVESVWAGTDSSGKGRTFDAFELAYMIAQMKSIWWGVGLGQVKIIGYDTIMDFYNYPRNQNIAVSIANSVADTMAVFGFVGVAVRFGLQGYFFFRTRVLSNYYRTLLFIFVFIYQFTGSNLANNFEYMLWLLAFSDCFPEFNVITYFPATEAADEPRLVPS